MLIKISRTEAVNPFYVSNIKVNIGKVIIVVGRLGGSAGQHHAESDYSFEDTIKLLNQKGDN